MKSVMRKSTLVRGSGSWRAVGVTGPMTLALGGLAMVSVALSGCAPVVLGGAAVGAATVAQERSVGNAIDDTSIRVSLNDKFLKADPEIWKGVETEVSEGRVLLAGMVPTPEDRVRAAGIAWSVPGVTRVYNELTVGDRSTVADYSRDVWIAAQVRTRLVQEVGVNSLNYTIETVNGTVYVLGIGQNAEEIRKVTDAVSRVQGVQKVVSFAVTKDDPRRTSHSWTETERLP